MSDTPSERRLAENEVTFRHLNEQAQSGLAAINELAHEDSQMEFMVSGDTPLYFYCECSSLSCTKRIYITFGEYGRIHRDRSNFTVVPGHEVLTIEQIVEKFPGYNVVHKFSDLPEQT